MIGNMMDPREEQQTQAVPPSDVVSDGEQDNPWEGAPTWDEIERIIISEVQAAREYQNTLADDRMRLWDRYAGKPLGNEEPGKSRYISRDIIDKIEWISPHLLSTFAMGDPKVHIMIEGQPEWVGQALMQRIQFDLSDSEPTLYRLFYDLFKNALVSGTSFVKVSWNREWSKVFKDIDAISHDQLMAMANADPTFRLENIPQVESSNISGIVYRGIRASTIKQISDQVYAEGVPPWEMLWSPDARHMDDEHPKGQITRVSLDYLKRINAIYSTEDEPYFRDLEVFESTAKGASRESQWATGNFIGDAEEKSYYEDSTSILGNGTTTTTRGTEGRRLLELVEWYTAIDIDGDGYLEPVTAWLADNKMIRIEQNPEGVIPFAKFCCFMDPYRFEGRSYAELLEDLQNLKTMLIRRGLDNLAWQNSGRWLVDPAGAVDIQSLLNNSPGDVVYGKTGSVTQLTPMAIRIRDVLEYLEYIDSIAENRTGLTRYNQGLDADSLNKTATGIVRIQEAGRARIHAIASNIAETGLRHFYRLCAMLYQRHVHKPIVMKVFGQNAIIFPEMLQGKIRCRVDLGLAAMIQQTEIARLDKVVGFLMMLNQMWPGVMDPKGIYAIVTRYLYFMGISDPSMIIPSIDEFMANIQQAQMTNAMLKQQEATMEHEGEMARVRQKDIKSLREYHSELLQMAAQNPLAFRFASMIDPNSLTSVQAGGIVPNPLMTGSGGNPPVNPLLLQIPTGGQQNARTIQQRGAAGNVGAGAGIPRALQGMVAQREGTRVATPNRTGAVSRAQGIV